MLRHSSKYYIELNRSYATHAFLCNVKSPFSPELLYVLPNMYEVHMPKLKIFLSA